MTKRERFETAKAVAAQSLEKDEDKMVILLTPYHGDDGDDEVEE